MKTFLIALTASFAFAAAPTLFAQGGPISTGDVVEVSKEKGMLIIQPEQQGVGRLVFYGMEAAKVETANGKAVTIGEISKGSKVTVQYAPEGDHWVVSKVIIPADTQTTVTGSQPVDHRFKSLYDGDITTNPGQKPPGDTDITKKAPKSADADGDITTHSGN